MSTFQYRVLGFCSFLLALCCGIAFLAMRSELDRGVGEGPPWWVLPGCVLFVVGGIRLVMKKTPDPYKMNDIDLIKYNMAQTRIVQYIVLVCVGGLAFVIFGLTFLGWDPSSNFGLFAAIVLGFLFAVCTMLSLFCISNIYNTYGGRARAITQRLLHRPQEIEHVEHVVTMAQGVPGSEHGTVRIQFNDGSSHLFQGAPDHAARLVQCLQERHPALLVNAR